MNTMKKIICILIAITLKISTQAQGYKIGDAAGDFSLLNVDGKKVSLADYKEAKGFIVVFTCNHCPFSQAYESRIMELDKKYSSRGFPVIAINPNDAIAVPDDSYENMKTVASEKKYTFPYLVDETQEVAKKFGATRTPHVFILKKEGDKNTVKYIGAIDNNTEDSQLADKKYVDAAVESILSDKSPAIAETKAIGCTIKWKK
jgi:peroxiredoxin